jgi:hypothetical protein
MLSELGIIGSAAHTNINIIERRSCGQAEGPGYRIPYEIKKKLKRPGGQVAGI